MRRGDLIASWISTKNPMNFVVLKVLFYIENLDGIIDDDSGDLLNEVNETLIPNLIPEEINISCNDGTSKKLLKLY